MKFPARDRVIYDPNPLAQVMCLISFPRILAIDNALPVSFQAALMAQFPFLETEAAEGGSTERADDKPLRSMIYEFHSADRVVSIALGSDFLGVRTKDYERWESFREYISLAIKTLIDNYGPKLFTRVALNYVNLIDRDELKLTDADWKDLIKPALLGALADPDVPEDAVESYHSVIELPIDGDANVRITAGLVGDDDGDGPSFLIDNLFYTEKAVDADELQSLGNLNRFNAESGRVFQWCIQSKLHLALNPRSVD
ncbi:uncharacterized protein (TIGR04255 family) [Rhodopseudomonas rhenobacensis]|uniref:Uncharacterized protein (TIGR04255 family) n=1 Tax=Rhodopseudomonas rhenobacensis TaxID=87461 RepID=A0A7W7Z1D5_9BRAD|nr:TIGR04255 family protein [Rhodopseudomonas rhenobacensis]MBB5046147.1 uncharacterized protein (TIGR04255 family) [Rhodopseudomonas rhenobacensis]